MEHPDPAVLWQNAQSDFLGQQQASLAARRLVHRVGGGYLHGIPSMFEPAGNRAARKAATARKLGTYPESHKCVRHLDDQIKFIYNWLGNSTPGSKTGYRVPEVPAMVIVK